MKTKPFKITAEGLENLLAELAGLPPKPKSEYSAREMLAETEVVIRNALALGYDLQDIAEMVAKHGGDINPGTLSAYLRELKTKPRGKSTKPKTKAGTADATPTATPISADSQKSTPTELGLAHADTELDRQQDEAESAQLLEQMKHDPDS